MIYFILIIMTILGSLASLFLKLSTCQNRLKSYKFYLGCSFYLLCAILNIYVLKYLDYSVAIPMFSLTYVWTLILSYFILKEKISKYKILGVMFIITGVTFINL